mmetsp:Transcript_28071/g.56414  ORF Transcript_28071/g.56414 Transcript_28071/m.56414 type:complete len:551 (-) Transcript_28071:145-1797(-)
MSSSAADLTKLQAAVKDLQSAQLNLPKNHHRSNNKENATNTTSPFTNPHLLQNYKSARQTYIQQRTTELFLDHLQQYNATTHTLSLPAPVDPSERSALQSRQTEILSNIQQTMESVNGGMQEVKVKYAAFEEKREEFVQIVEGMERQRIIMSDDDDDHMDKEEENGEEITEQDVAEQQDHLHQLQQRKLDLENRLRSVQAQIVDVEDDCHRTKQVVNEVREKTGRRPLDWSGFTENEGGGTDGNDVEYICNVDNEIVELQEKAAELKQSSDFYDGIRELMEELGGVKILSSSACEQEEDGFTLTLKLLGSHLLDIRLKKSSSVGGGGGSNESLFVASAKLTTPTTFPMPESQPETMTEDTENLTETINQSLSNVSLSKIMSQKQTVSIVIPPLDDLVKWSRSLESSQGIRFVLVETMARIRTLDARVAELTHLRQNYAAQVYDIETNLESAQFGGAEQEVVCAINEGITVALRLTVDCPLVPGSVYISELFGVGGWEEEKLAALKKVVDERRCKGPVEVMEVMVKEIRRRRHEEGWAIPLTPSLPRGRKE